MTVTLPIHSVVISEVKKDTICHRLIQYECITYSNKLTNWTLAVFKIWVNNCYVYCKVQRWYNRQFYEYRFVMASRCLYAHRMAFPLQKTKCHPWYACPCIHNREHSFLIKYTCRWSLFCCCCFFNLFLAFWKICEIII